MFPEQLVEYDTRDIDADITLLLAQFELIYSADVRTNRLGDVSGIDEPNRCFASGVEPRASFGVAHSDQVSHRVDGPYTHSPNQFLGLKGRGDEVARRIARYL